ncbi:putative acetyltransferase [Halobacillus dabanensis]|uniref:Putative acetyltransferase n=1 Tax=Halobacillus dabanensis TaxID=240302 RepID=A0A1I4AZA2_HALDA|nr:N-acetyltransferase [Halobacillus dabanensis]SFK61237.1 putative acetyltransferase [Halobacillus dabanensis]
MNIRRSKETELNRLVDIWYEGSIIAHDFIENDYWESQRNEMREKYLPMAETYVISDEKEVVGFISMVDNYLAALFIHVNHQGEGYGQRLLNYIKKQKNIIQLKVYEKNSQAVNFYLKNGFAIKEKLLDERTTEGELLMRWERV